MTRLVSRARAARVLLGITLEELSDATGINIGTLSSFERGRIKFSREKEELHREALDRLARERASIRGRALRQLGGAAVVALLTLLVPASARAQDYATSLSDYAVRLDGGPVVGGGTGAPTDAAYIVQTGHADLTDEQILADLASGLVLNTTTTGVLSIYAGADCTNQFIRDLSAAGAPTCGSVGSADITDGAVALGDIADAAANSKLLGSGDAGSGSPYAEITLGTNLSMSGTTLNAAGGGSTDWLTTMQTQEEFLGSRTSATSTCAGGGGGIGLSVINSGAGSGAVTNLSGDYANHPGLCTWTTGTTTTGFSTLVSGFQSAAPKSDLFALAEDLEWIECVEALSGGGETYILRGGYANDDDGAVPDQGCWVEYTDTVNSGNYVLRCADADGTPTDANTAVAPTVCPTFQRIRISVNADGTQVDVHFDGGASAANVTGDIPTTAGQEFGLGFTITKTGGTTTRGHMLDAIKWTKTVSR